MSLTVGPGDIGFSRLDLETYVSDDVGRENMVW